ATSSPACRDSARRPDIRSSRAFSTSRASPGCRSGCPSARPPPPPSGPRPSADRINSGASFPGETRGEERLNEDSLIPFEASHLEGRRLLVLAAHTADGGGGPGGTLCPRAA